MPVPLLSALCGPSQATSLCIPNPAGGQICLQTTRLGVQSALLQWLRLIDSWLATILPQMPLILVLKILQDLINVIKAIATLDPVQIATAIEALAVDIASIAGMLPPLAYPIMLVQLLRALYNTFDALYNHLNWLLTVQTKLLQQQALAATLGNLAMIQANRCALNNFNVRIGALNGALANLTAIFGIIKLLLCLAQIPVTLPAVPIIDPSALADALIPIKAVRDALGVIVGIFGSPAPGTQVSC